MELREVWPLAGLELRTPRLRLHPVRDADLPGLASAALAGIHDPAVMPFGVPWTDQDPGDLPRELARFHWGLRAGVTPEAWNIEFAVIRDDAVIGAQGLLATQFPTLRQVSTGSWLTQSAQGQGLGTEMRQAVLLFAFDHLGATLATSGAAVWNDASNGVSRALGYVPDGSDRVTTRPGTVDEVIRLRLDPADFVRPDWSLEVTGLDAVKAQLGLNDD